MAFNIFGPFSYNRGVYGEIFWCGYNGDPKQYVCKRLLRADVSLEIEHEASRRLRFLPTVYKTKGIENVEGVRWLVSEYLEGVLLEDYRGLYRTNLLLHLLCTLEEMREKKICHNDLHAGNILVVPSSLEYVRYLYNGRIRMIKVFDVIPVVIDFGLARIDDFQYKPMITGMARGNLASLIHDPRFDKLKLLDIFSRILTDKELAHMAKFTGLSLLKRSAKWISQNVYKLWAPLDYELEFVYKNLYKVIDYNLTGLLLSYPDVPLPTPHDRQKYMRLLNEIAGETADFQELLVTVLRAGPDHNLFAPVCVLSTFFRMGIADFLADRPDILEGVPLKQQWISFILKRHPNYRIA